MITHPEQRTVEFDRPTFIRGALVPVGERRTFPNAFATELVSARKAHFFVEPPAVAAAEQQDAPVVAAAALDHSTPAVAAATAKKGR